MSNCQQPPAVIIGGGVLGASSLYHGQGPLDRLHPAREERADRRFDLARGRQCPRPSRRPGRHEHAALFLPSSIAASVKRSTIR